MEGRIRSKLCSSSRKFWHEWLDNLWGDNWTNYRNSAPSPKTITATKMQNNYKLTWALSSHFWEPLQQAAMNNKLKLHLLWSEFNAGHVCGSQLIIHPHHPGYSAPPATTPKNRNKRKMIYPPKIQLLHSSFLMVITISTQAVLGHTNKSWIVHLLLVNVAIRPPSL